MIIDQSVSTAWVDLVHSGWWWVGQFLITFAIFIICTYNSAKGEMGELDSGSPKFFIKKKKKSDLLI